ncbi:MAG: hypothetical protein IPK77_12295 [Cellvibrio sp.]|jgi:hypothetical protein|nr:hypothetical protein [Cellvibrio sp.]
MRLFISRILQFLLYCTLFLLLTVICYLSFSPVPSQQSPETLEIKIRNLHQTAAVWVPHFDIDEGKVRSQHLSLFEKVETGQQLTIEEGQTYRQHYQGLLLEHQPFFSQFDSQLVAITNLGMDQQNNVGSHGIEGHHDHHDESSRNNFIQIENSLEVLKKGNAKNSFFSINRIQNAISIYKNLNDILFHLATVPHTKSIYYHELSGDISPDRTIFESMLQSFKAAQFMPVNSPEYQANVRSALNDYRELVLLSEELVHSHLSPIELKFVGQWGGWQSLTPKVSDNLVDY